MSGEFDSQCFCCNFIFCFEVTTQYTYFSVVYYSRCRELEWEWVGMRMGMIRWEWERNGNKKVIPAHLYNKCNGQADQTSRIVPVSPNSIATKVVNNTTFSLIALSYFIRSNITKK